MSSAAHSVEVAVIGAGVVGLAVARALALSGKEVIILEREGRFGSGTSSRNSEVIHAGIYYPHESLKAKFCVEGKHMLYRYCKDRNIPHRNVGKLIVATNKQQQKSDLQRILNHATKNGVDMKLLSSDDVRRNLEPNVTCHGALYSPSTGIVNSHELMSSLLVDAEDNGAILALKSPVGRAQVFNDESKQNIMLEVCGMDLRCNTVINCAGLYAGHIASKIFDSIDGNETSSSTKGRYAHQYFAKGNYFKLEGQKTPFQHLIYPVPEKKGGLGVHSTVDLAGAMKFGPDVQWIDKNITNPSEIDLTVDPSRADIFYSEVRSTGQIYKMTHSSLTMLVLDLRLDTFLILQVAHLSTGIFSSILIKTTAFMVL